MKASLVQEDLAKQEMSKVSGMIVRVIHGEAG
jgi:hypothetical protein